MHAPSWRSLRALSLAAALLVPPGAASCGAARPHPNAAVDPASTDARVGTFVSSPWGFSTSSYWIEGPTGLIFIDTQFLPSAAERSIARAEELTGKRVELAIVLHANPDKYNGVGVFRRRGIRVVTAAQVVARIPEVDVERRGFFAQRYAPDYPAQVTLPESFGDHTTRLTAGGTTVTAHVFGAGCSNAHVVVEWEGHVFPGDLVANRNHSWLKEADVDGWLARLGEIRALGPRFVHPGRGPTGGPDLLDAEERYLRLAQRLIADERPRLPVDEAGVTRVRERLEAAYPGYGFAVFLRIGIPAEWQRQAARAAATP